MIKVFVENFKELFSGLSRVLIVTHPNADPDALASAVIVSRLLAYLSSRGCIGVPEGLSKISKTLVEKLSIALELCDQVGEVDGCIVVDASNPVQLGSYKDVCLSAKVKALIDHHELGLLGESFDLRLVDPKATSTTELLVHVVNEMGFKLGGVDSTLAVAGIVYDSRRFSKISSYTFNAMNLLVSWGCDYEKALSSMVVERSEVEDLSRRVAMLKALSRLRLERACHDLLIAVTHIGSNESEVARTLVNLGADIAIVVVEREDKARISIRTSSRALAKGVKASTIASYIASRYEGEGGGHDAAAMAHVPMESDVDKLVDSIARSIPGKIGRLCQEQGENRIV